MNPGPVVYWMSRDQRVNDNWALLFAQELALKLSQPLGVVFCLVPDYSGAGPQHYRFMQEGLREVRQKLRKLNIPFFLLSGSPAEVLSAFFKRNCITTVVADFNPLRINRKWKEELLQFCTVPMFEVDAHNIVPCRVASQKQEFGAYTLRPKIARLLPVYLKEFPDVTAHPFHWKNPSSSNENFPDSIPDHSPKEATYSWIRPGETAAMDAARNFISGRLRTYENDRNDPNLDGQSGLSPFLHFGQISAQRLALMVRERNNEGDSARSFLEELIIRRELSDNYCFYNHSYDSFEGFHAWAKKTLNDHRNDPRQFLYTLDQFESGSTHDPLWNAAQKEMAGTGKMHGFMRMYWAKKILEWTSSPEEAQAIAIYLNDKYSLDGRDPNGYAGIAWSLGGVHDRAWGERPVFGKIRYMNDAGCRRKFNVSKYIERNGL